MKTRINKIARTALTLSAVSLLVLTTGCGRSGDTNPAKDTVVSNETGQSAASLVPADLKAAGVLKVATAEGYPPMEMYKEGTQELIGVDPELGALIAKQLDLKFQITNSSFPGLIPGLQSKQWDLAISSMSDTEKRRNAVNFVDYFMAGGAIMVKKGNPEGITGIADLCGKKIVGAKGSSNLAILENYSKDECETPMTISESEDAPTGLLQIDTNRAIATVVDYPVAKQLAAKAGTYEVLPEQYDAGPWGIAIDKKNTELTAAIKAALQELMDNGEYQKLLEKYDVADAGVKEATLNDGK
ncbi:ABC transporter substrate-binding protein [Arthrobacter psychrolactophilus]|uniref:ABC transporter substrate-binding protein n=1 Tax=Arthrobacter psychrolactophilus TaxID=92442 RepID=A0A2V5IY40_9MICC|nr:ABC transporter substrate-binding protein [Arthrobacter psychrolactophilus]PYI39244.1 ABC transporter substrate-binding protein [Arthrobacter psychrolactophilus]